MTTQGCGTSASRRFVAATMETTALASAQGALKSARPLLAALLIWITTCFQATTLVAQFTTIIDSPPAVIGDNETIKSNTQLNLFEGATVRRLGAGMIGTPNQNIEVNILGGSIEGLTVYDGSVVNLLDGSIRGLRAFEGSQFMMSGGALSGILESEGATLIISGGTIEILKVYYGSEVTLLGGDFRLDGQPIAGSESIGDRVTLDVPQDAVFSGVFADGTPFAFTPLDVVFLQALDYFGQTVSLETAELPPVGPPLIIASMDSVPLGIRDGQTIVVGFGGVIPDHFNAGRGSTVIVEEGGRVGINLEAVNATVNISGGFVEGFDAFDGSDVGILGGVIGRAPASSTGHGAWRRPANVVGSEVEVSGGTVEAQLVARARSDVTISGGDVAMVTADDGGRVTISGGSVDTLNSRAGSQVIMTGGSLGGSFDVWDDAEVFISGGTIGQGFRVFGGSRVNLYGTEFQISGIPLSLVALGESFPIADRNVQLTGTLSNGSPVSIDLNSALMPQVDYIASDATFTVNLVSLLPGDFDSNGTVEQSDLDLVLLNWGNDLVNPYSAGWINDLPTGGIDQEEFDRVLLNWGSTVDALGAAAVIPEPSALALAFIVTCMANSLCRPSPLLRAGRPASGGRRA